VSAIERSVEQQLMKLLGVGVDAQSRRREGGDDTLVVRFKSSSASELK